jgi:hypothetical protein
MALQQKVVLQQIRELVEEATGLERVFGAANEDEHQYPEAAMQFPCAFVIPGQTTDYMLSGGQHRHTYEVAIQVLHAPGMSIGQAYAALAGYTDMVIAKFTQNVALGGRVNSCVFARSSGMRLFDSGDISFPGIEITLRVSEQAEVATAAGS